jgi:hypothetical protein
MWDALKRYGEQREDFSYLLFASATVDLQKLTASSQPIEIKQTSRAAQRVMADNLRRIARGFGGTGGLVTTQFGPVLSESPVWREDELYVDKFAGLRLVVCMLAELADPVGVRTLLRASDSALRPRLQVTHEGLTISANLTIAEWPTGRQITDVVRGFLIAPTGGQSEQSPGSVVSALSWEPWHLANTQQWLLHWRISRHWHLYDPWGDWKNLFRRVPNTSRTRVPFVNADQRRGLVRRRRSFAENNDQRQHRAAARRESLWRVLLRISQTTPFTNARISRETLRTTMRDHGYDISDRDARELVRRCQGQGEIQQ